MKKNPRVSVIVPVFNTGSLICETIASVIAQTFTDWELLLIDDGSSDDMAMYINSFSDSRIRYIRQENCGMARTRARGVELAAGEYLAFLDHDDLWLPEKLSEQVHFLETHTDFDMVYSPVTMFFPDGRHESQPEPPLAPEFPYRQLLLHNLIKSASCVMIRKNTLIANHLSFRTKFVPCDDFDLWLRIALRGKIGYIPAPLVRYRYHEKNVSNDSSRMERALFRVYFQQYQELFRTPVPLLRKLFLLQLLTRSIWWLRRTRGRTPGGGK